ncbi:Rsp5p-dependent ubiquitination, sorting of cargo proteins at the multivesicular body [Actinomortierella wolfii]|nr:Rsp5p-dependent ubiquitination, sorting of cargo proteins at the multivesicular body [Actinomortierella wolfii]
MPPPQPIPPVVPPLVSKDQELSSIVHQRDFVDQPNLFDSLSRADRPQDPQPSLQEEHQEQEHRAHSQERTQERQQRIPPFSHTFKHSDFADSTDFRESVHEEETALPDSADWKRLQELVRQTFFPAKDKHSKEQSQDQEQDYADVVFSADDTPIPYPSSDFSTPPPLPPLVVRPTAIPLPRATLLADPDHLPEEGDNPTEGEDLSWLIFSIATSLLIFSCVSLLRACSHKPWFASIMGAEYSTLHGPGGQGSQGIGGHHRGGAGSGPLQVAADDEANQELSPEELEAHLAVMTDAERQSFEAAREKGVSAWEFEPSYDHRLLVHDRTELSFFDREASVQTNLPLPKQQEVYYWEVKMFEKSPNTTVAIGVSTKPYPTTRLPGWNRHSVAYFSTGLKYYNAPWSGIPYGPAMYEGDVVGCGYRPRTGTIFFTRNGKRIEDAYTGLRYNLFPTVGATGPCVLHVNFGQSGFVFVEANVKKWGLAPATGSLVPPPAYGSERGSILLEAGSTSSPMTTTQVPRRPPLRSSQSRARVQAAGILVQIDDNEADHYQNGGGGGGGVLAHGRYGTPPVDISLSDISAPPPKYTSLDQHGGTQSHLAAAVARGASSATALSSSSSASSSSSTAGAGVTGLNQTGSSIVSIGSRGRSGSRTSRATAKSDSESDDDSVTLLVDARPTAVAQDGIHDR